MTINCAERFSLLYTFVVHSTDLVVLSTVLKQSCLGGGLQAHYLETGHDSRRKIDN